MAGVGAWPTRVDPADPQLIADPYALYVRLRREGPLCRFGPGGWGVTRYGDVARLLREPGLTKFSLPAAFLDRAIGPGPVSDFFQRMDIGRSDPAVRRLLTHEFSAASTRRRTGVIRPIVARALQRVVDATSHDGVSELARPLSMDLLGDVLGLSHSVRPTVARCVAILAEHADVVPAAGSVDGGNRAVEECRDTIGEHLRLRERGPRDDVLSRLAAVATTSEARRRSIDVVLALLYAGVDTTTNLIAAGLAALAEHPDQFRRLHRSPTMAASAVEEFIRYDSPIQITLRSVGEPITVHDRLIKTGRTLALFLGSANRDERIFEAPDRLDIGRDPNPHVGFGGGPYHCFGAALARLNATVTFTELTRVCAAIEPAGPPSRGRQVNFRTYTRLPIALRTG